MDKKRKKERKVCVRTQELYKKSENNIYIVEIIGKKKRFSLKRYSMYMNSLLLNGVPSVPEIVLLRYIFIL